jgi:predicted RecB family endonuclease
MTLLPIHDALLAILLVLSEIDSLNSQEKSALLDFVHRLQNQAEKCHDYLAEFLEVIKKSDRLNPLYQKAVKAIESEPNKEELYGLILQSKKATSEPENAPNYALDNMTQSAKVVEETIKNWQQQGTNGSLSLKERIVQRLTNRIN